MIRELMIGKRGITMKNRIEKHNWISSLPIHKLAIYE